VTTRRRRRPLPALTACRGGKSGDGGRGGSGVTRGRGRPAQPNSGSARQASPRPSRQLLLRAAKIWSCRWPAQGTAEQRCRPAWRDEHVDDLPLPRLIDRPIDVAPSTGDLHIRLIHLPAICDPMAPGPGGLSEQRREPLDPPVDGDVVDLDAALGEQLFDVAVGEAKRRYQRTASTITSGGKQKPARADRAMGSGRTR
jgi:hypothetical protein